MMLDPGTYRGYLKEAVTSEGKDASLRMEVMFAIRHVSHDDAWQEIAEAERTIYLYLSEKARPYTDAKLKALGFNGDFESPIFDARTREEGIDLVCRHEQYDGNTGERWELKNWKSKAKPAATDKLKRLNALWNTSNKQSPISGPPPVAAPVQSTRDTAWNKLKALKPEQD